jgi:predicted nucleic acid-binding protein
MNFLLDTNVLAEAVKPLPDPRVVTWLAESDEDRLFLSVVSFAEIRRGIEAMAGGHRRERLVRWLADDLPSRFAGRILDIDRSVAEDWGSVTVQSAQSGVTMAVMDAFLAATARTHGLTLVTRKARDFQAAGLDLFDPWGR